MDTGSKRILEGHYQPMLEKSTVRTRKTRVVTQGEAVASWNFGKKDVDSEAGGKITKKTVIFLTDLFEK